MIELALKSRIPVVSVETDDLLNYTAVLTALAGGRKVMTLPAKESEWSVHGDAVFVTTEADRGTLKLYQWMLEHGRQTVFVNPSKAVLMAFDAGTLTTPAVVASKVIGEHVDEGEVPALLPLFAGLSVRGMTELIMFTQGQHATLTPAHVRKTRGMMGGNIQGLTPLDTEVDFYVPTGKLEDWLALNADYFTSPTNPKLTPRGLLLDGPPGVGKTMASRVIASRFDVPLYRLDVAAVLDKYVGASEARVARILSMVEHEAPCVLLIDEVEKLFGDGYGDVGVTTRILSQLLWWLQEHQARVFTVMTTNKSEAIPPELYRAGRLDARITIDELTRPQAFDFACAVMLDMFGTDAPTLVSKVYSALSAYMELMPTISHAAVTEVVMAEIKRNKWL